MLTGGETAQVSVPERVWEAGSLLTPNGDMSESVRATDLPCSTTERRELSLVNPGVRQSGEASR